MEMKKSARRRHCSKIFKTNLKTHISPLLNRPQGCQGCQKNRKDLRITTLIRFAANFQPKLNELHKHLQNQQKSLKYAGFLVIFSSLAEN